MTKIAIIGAGGYVFPLRLVGDLLSFSELRDATIALMDIDADRLERTASAARELVNHHRYPTRIEATTDRRRALDGATHVVVTFQVGGLDAYRLDVEIPRRYGLDQTVGDTLGPGDVFRFLRSAPVYRSLAVDMAELCPEALLINYANPMAMSCWYLDRLGITTVGLCHSVQNTSRMLARQLGVPYDEVDFLVAGINHQAWFLRFQRGDDDLYPRLREVMTRRHLEQTVTNGLTADRGEHSEEDRGDSVYEGGASACAPRLWPRLATFTPSPATTPRNIFPTFAKMQR
jgi:alpha-galactosidase